MGVVTYHAAQAKTAVCEWCPSSFDAETSAGVLFWDLRKRAIWRRTRTRRVLRLRRAVIVGWHFE